MKSPTPWLLAACTSLVVASVSCPALAHDPHGDRAKDGGLLNSIAFFEARILEDPADLYCLARLGGLKLQAARSSGEHEDFAAAERALAAVVAENPKDDGAQLGLAYALLGQHRFREALRISQRVANRRPEEPTVLALAGDCHFALGHLLEAELIYQRLVDTELTLQSLSRLAQIREERGQLVLAEDLYRQARQAGELLDEQPGKRAWCHSMLGSLYLGQGRLAEAEQEFQSAVSLDPHAHFARSKLATIASENGQHDVAEHLLRELVPAAPLPQYWLALGRTLEERDKTAEAQVWFARAEQDMVADLDRGDLGHLRELAEFWLSQGRQFDRALELARQDLRDVRQDAGARETVAWALHCLGRSKEALPHIRSAIVSGSCDTRRLRRASEIYDAVGQHVAADHLRSRVVDIESTTVESRQFSSQGEQGR